MSGAICESTTSFSADLWLVCNSLWHSWNTATIQWHCNHILQFYSLFKLQIFCVSLVVQQSVSGRASRCQVAELRKSRKIKKTANARIWFNWIRRKLIFEKNKTRDNNYSSHWQVVFHAQRHEDFSSWDRAGCDFSNHYKTLQWRILKRSIGQQFYAHHDGMALNACSKLGRRHTSV